jgi:hypothetical protein
MAFRRKEYHKEEKCLNCGYPLLGKFCAECGQKAFLHKDSFLHMAAHFAGDYFHYDSKFWITMKTLFLKPGVATLEYNAGKRAKFLSPVQLYIFITTVFFIAAFSVSSEDKTSAVRIEQETASDTGVVIPAKVLQYTADTATKRKKSDGLAPREKTLAAYDSVQKSLPADQRDGYFVNRVRRNSYHHTGDLTEELLHHLPKIFFLLLPLFALWLSLLFRKDKLYYVDHLVFAIHFHSVCFALLLVNILLVNIFTNELFNNMLSAVSLAGIPVYLFFSLRKVYSSSVVRVLMKMVLLVLLYFIGFLFSAILLGAIYLLYF